jgi:hypothetical protein
VRTLHLTDDELWCAIADNTNALSALIEKQCGWDAELEAPAIVDTLVFVGRIRITVSIGTILQRFAVAIPRFGQNAKRQNDDAT